MGGRELGHRGRSGEGVRVVRAWLDGPGVGTTAPGADDVSNVFARLRVEEFPFLRTDGVAYLDYTGAALPPRRLMRAHHQRLERTLLGNPHSEHVPSRNATSIMERARERVVRELGGDPDEHTAIFTANASSALRLVGESWPFGPDRPFVMTADNHNSVTGIRSFAAARQAPVHVLPLDGELRLDAPGAHLDAVQGRGLFAFPAQSNFSGVRHPLGLAERATRAGHRVLLDAAAYLPTARLDLKAVPADFVALSVYKIFGYPTGVGVLVARREALAELERPWFAGGTVAFVSVRHGVHRLLDGASRFEDGTPDFQGLAALDSGWDFMHEIGWDGPLGRHVAGLTQRILDGLAALRHPDGRPAVALYGPTDLSDRGGAVCFNAVDAAGQIVPFARVEEEAARQGVAVRGGCFCNPGASEAAFRPPEPELAHCLDKLRTGPFAPERLQACLGRGPVGALRASPGMASDAGDVDRLLEVVARAAGIA